MLDKNANSGRIGKAWPTVQNERINSGYVLIAFYEFDVFHPKTKSRLGPRRMQLRLRIEFNLWDTFYRKEEISFHS